MLVDQVVNHLGLGLFHARMLTLLRSTFPQTAMDLILRQELTNGFQSVYIPPTTNNVGIYYGGDNTRKIMYLDGVVTSLQSAELILGYQKFGGLQIINGPNIWIRDNFAIYMNAMAGGHLQFPQYLDLVGYSAGGAVAECMAFELRRLGNTQNKKVFTYGSPRPGGPNVRDALAHFPIVRYMTPGDAIPLVPPRLQDAPQLVGLLPVSIALSWSNMVHPRGGVVVYPDGRTGDAIEPPDAAMTPGTSLASWYFVLEGEDGNQHSMRTYVSNLIAAVARADQPAEQKIELGPAEQPDEPRRRDVNKARDRVVAKIALAQREQNAQIVNQPAIVLFRPVRNGRVWTVVLGDRIVCQGVREDTCRHLCRAGNDFLRSLPKQGLVDPIALSAQIENFLVFATSPESEWIPKLRTNIDLS